MKQIKLTTLIFGLLLLGCNQAHTSSEGQNQTNVPKDNTKSEIKDTVTLDWPGDTVQQIKKGSNGTILIASHRAVFRYDRKSFTNLTNKLSSHLFNDVLEDRKGNLWLAANDSGAYYYDGNSFQHFTTREGLANNRVICIYEDKTGIVWFGTAVGISRYDGKSFQNFKMKGEDWFYNFITTFIEDKTGKLWISARGDIYIYDGKTFTNFTNGKVVDVYSIIEDKKGNIWLGGWDGVRRYDGKVFTNFEYNKGYNFIIEDKKGNIWTSGSIGGSTWALSRYDQKSLNDKYPTVTKIMSEPVRTFSGILEADDGSIWFGTDGGLYRYDGKTIRDFRSKEENK